MNNSLIKRVLFSFLPVIIVAVLGSIFVNIGMDWFTSLSTPSQWIPAIIIPIVWSIIYVAFAISIFIWSKDKLKASTIVLLIVNGILNIVWCLVFFTLKQLFVGNIFIVINLIFGWLLLKNIYDNKKVFSYFLIIYPVWLSVATSLNIALWILN